MCPKNREREIFAQSHHDFWQRERWGRILYSPSFSSRTPDGINIYRFECPCSSIVVLVCRPVFSSKTCSLCLKKRFFNTEVSVAAFLSCITRKMFHQFFQKTLFLVQRKLR